MATYPVKMLKDEGGALFLPLTSTTAVLDDNNNTIEDLLDDKQDTLVSGTNIKTINNNSLLGSGNITISGGQATDVQINGTSITSSNVANIRTNGTYNASTNKIATMNDLPTVPTKVSDLTNDSNFVTNTDYPTSSVAGVVKGGVNGFSIGATGNPFPQTFTYSNYVSAPDYTFIGKGTLENILTGIAYETTNNKVTSISSSSTNTQYPSALAVYNYINSLNGNGVSY